MKISRLPVHLCGLCRFSVLSAGFAVERIVAYAQAVKLTVGDTGMPPSGFSGVPLPQNQAAHGFAIGVFDLLHVGHLRYLRQARNHCHQLIVAVTPDEMVERYKKRLPVIPYLERLEMVAGLACVTRAVQHAVSMEETEQAAIWIASLGVQHVFIGDDWAGSARWNHLGPALAGFGLEVSFIPRTAEVSSTDIRQRLIVLSAR